MLRVYNLDIIARTDGLSDLVEVDVSLRRRVIEATVAVFPDDLSRHAALQQYRLPS